MKNCHFFIIISYVESLIFTIFTKELATHQVGIICRVLIRQGRHTGAIPNGATTFRSIEIGEGNTFSRRHIDSFLPQFHFRTFPQLHQAAFDVKTG
jgi:hypothetical protein